MKRRALAAIIAIIMVFSIGGNVFASYDPTTYGYNYNGYYGENYYNYNYSNYSSRYYMSGWAEDLKVAYDPTLYESVQREVTRGEAFLLFLRAVQRSLDRQGYSRLMSGYVSVPFTDYNSVNPYAQGEVNVLYANGILVGYDDNTMRFSQKLTRAEMAAIYSRFNRIYFNMGMGYNQWNYDGYNNYYNNNYNNYYNNYVFNDIVGHWAAQDIITAASNGVLRGMGNNYFDTEGPLTIEQIWKMLDCCVGYQGLKRSDIAYALSQTFKIKFGKNIDESYGTANGTKISRMSSSVTSLSIYQGETRNVKISISPTNAEYQKLNWTSSNTNYVSIEESWNSAKGTAYVTIYGRRPTSSYITITGRAMDGSGKTVSFKVKVNDDYDYDYDYDNSYITSITPSESTVYLDIGESVSLNARVKPSDADYKNLAWTSRNSNIAYVSNVYLSGNYSYATIIANNAGTTYVDIEALDGSGEQETVKVVVNDNMQADSVVTSATASPSSVRMNVGENQNVTLTVYPTNATDKNIEYVSDNQNIATVQKISNTSIRIVGVGVGTTNIRGIASATGREVCVIPVTINANQINDGVAPEVQITGANIITRDEFVTLTITAYDDDLASFNIKKSDILGMTGAGVSVHDIVKVSDNVYQVTLLGVEVSIGEVCVAAGVAVDKAGNRSAETDGVVIKVLAKD